MSTNYCLKKINEVNAEHGTKFTAEDLETLEEMITETMAQFLNNYIDEDWLAELGGEETQGYEYCELESSLLQAVADILS